jgi:hypothetical protein
MSEKTQATRAVALLAANGAALAMAAQFSIDHLEGITPGVARMCFTFLLFTFTGTILAYLLLLDVGKPSFRVREIFAASFFGVHVLALCIGLMSHFV